VLSQGNGTVPLPVAVLFGLKFADNIHYKFKRSQASKAKLQSSKHTGAKQNVHVLCAFPVCWLDKQYTV